MDIMNVLRTGMKMSISRIHIWLCNNMTDRLLIAVHAFASRVSMSVSVDETMLPWEANLSTSFRELLFSEDISPV